MLRIGLLTSGGDCQALNATMRGIVKTLMTNSKEPIEIYGFEDGYQGLIYSRFRVMTPADFSGILTRGGTILGTSRTPFKRLGIPEADGVEKVPAMVHTYHKLQLDCLFMLGGNGSTKTANRLREEGLNVIALPKTIDNDTWGTELTFGFTSAIDVATKCIDDIHTTASSHGRVFVIEIMGHKVGWIPLYAGVAGGADVILIPEIPYDMDNVIKTIEHRMETGSRFTIVAVAEGAISKEDAAVVTDDSTYLRRTFTDGKELVMFSLKELQTLPERVFDLFGHISHMQEIADCGYHAAKEEHTWKNRAEYIRECYLDE